MLCLLCVCVGPVVFEGEWLHTGLNPFQNSFLCMISTIQAVFVHFWLSSVHAGAYAVISKWNMRLNAL